MNTTENDLHAMEAMFRRTDKPQPKGTLARLLYIPVDKRMRILRELLLPLSTKGA